MKHNFILSEIDDGQYCVTLDLNELMEVNEISIFIQRFNEICNEDNDFKQVCSINGHILKYRSESLFPPSDKIKSGKKKVMIIVGNPATHSIIKRMFFYSRGGEKDQRHQFWGKAETAELIRPLDKTIIDMNDRATDAKTRKAMILEGDTSDKYTLGLTTFYSFPTPAKPRNEAKKESHAKTKYGDAVGVEKLFKPALPKLQQMEFDRLNSYDFAHGAIWIFTQLSSYRYIKNISRIEYWPMFSMSGGSGGEDLKKILRMP